MKKYRYNINNLECANCARAIEDSLNKNKDFCVTIPMKKITRSLNLSNSVAIATYEAVRQFDLDLG